MDSVRLYKQGFPTFLPLGEFRRKFWLLAGDHKVQTSPVLDERKSVEDMLLALDLELSSYRIGLSQVSDVLFIIGSWMLGWACVGLMKLFICITILS